MRVIAEIIKTEPAAKSLALPIKGSISFVILSQIRSTAVLINSDDRTAAIHKSTIVHSIRVMLKNKANEMAMIAANT